MYRIKISTKTFRSKEKHKLELVSYKEKTRLNSDQTRDLAVVSF